MKALLTAVVSLLGGALALSAGTATAQIDLSGTWVPENFQHWTIAIAGPFPADFLGVPLNAQARAAALSYSPESLEELNRQCKPWPVHYILHGPFGFRISSITKGVTTGVAVGWHVSGWLDKMPMNIWVDGRAPPPPQALHTYGGFSTGVWHGDTLETTTTHLTDGFLTRNGVPNSDHEVFRMFMSRHGKLLTITGIVHDRVYLTAPYATAQVYRLSAASSTNTFRMTCAPEEVLSPLSDGYHAANVLPGKSPTLRYMTRNYGIPLFAAMGGAQTMYPAFEKKLQGHYKRPAGYCPRFCCGTVTGGRSGGYDEKVLHCNVDL